MNEKSHIRLFKIILTYWPFLLLSTIAAIFFVIFNATSVWITATMINNVLIEFLQECVNTCELVEPPI